MPKNSGVSFTVDIWTAEHTTQCYMSLTAHWLQSDFLLRSAVLHCIPFDDRHTSDNIGSMFREMLTNWNISLSNCHTILHDNAPNITKAFREMNFIGLQQFPCFAHSLQLVIKDGIFGQNESSEILATGRKLVGHFKKSSSATNRLHILQKELNLPLSQLIQDVPTHWNSTLDLLKRLLEQLRAISIFCTETDDVSNVNLSQLTTVEQII